MIFLSLDRSIYYKRNIYKGSTAKIYNTFINFFFNAHCRRFKTKRNELTNNKYKIPF